MTNRERIAASILRHSTLPADQGPYAAEGLLEDLQAAGLAIMPDTPTVRLRHEATKGVPGITAAAFGTMWRNLVAYARTLDR